MVTRTIHKHIKSKSIFEYNNLSIDVTFAVNIDDYMYVKAKTPNMHYLLLI